MRISVLLVAGLLGPSLAGSAASAATVTLGSAHDNTLIQVPPRAPAFSNGAGEHFFCGSTAFNGNRRGLISFDLASIPSGSTITGVTLTLTMTLTISGPQPVELHRVLTGWGEGMSDALKEEGGGALATPGDATWVHTYFPKSTWTTPGGDFSPVVSAVTPVASNGVYTWSGPGMVADLQSWLDDPAGNFGWLVLGNELLAATAKRFDTHEVTIPENRPQLAVTYSPPCPADFNHSGSVNGLDLAALLAAWTGAGAYAPCPPYVPQDLNHDCKVNGLDLASLLAAWGPCPG